MLDASVDRCSVSRGMARALLFGRIIVRSRRFRIVSRIELPARHETGLLTTSLPRTSKAAVVAALLRDFR